jgi:hypothetical protein
MLGAYVCCAIICVASLTLGRAIWSLCGTDRWTWTAPAVGFAGLLVIVDITIRLPGGGWTSLSVVIVLLMLSATLIVRNGLGIEIDALLGTALPVVLVVAVLASGNYLINENFGIPGVSMLNDFAGHLPWTEALSTHNAPFKLIIPGYPLGCFALAGTLGKLPGVSVLAAFQGILIATPILIAITTMVLFAPLSTFFRVMAATVVALAYLITAAFVEGAFKEPIEALLIVAIALSLQELARISERRHLAAAIPIAVLVAGSVANYSYPGLTWPGLIVGSWLVLEALRRRHTISRSLVGQVFAVAVVGTTTLILLALPEIFRFHAFEQAQVATLDAQTGNVPTMLPWRETLGIWFSDDFRIWQTQSLDFQHALLIFAAAVFSFGVVQAWRRCEAGLLAMLAAALVVATYARNTANAYNDAKAMMVLSCAVVLVCIRGVLPTGALRLGVRQGQRDIPKLQIAGALVAVLFAAACLWSAGLVLRNSLVGPSNHDSELAHLDPMLRGHNVLFLGQDDFAAWELRGTHLAYLTTYDIPSLPISFRSNKPFVVGEPADFDTVTAQTLNDFSYVVTPRSAFASVPPPNWHPVAGTRFYEVWARVGPTAPHATLAEEGGPGAILNCSTPAGRILSRTHGTALVRVPPVVLDGGGWQGLVAVIQPDASVLQAGAKATQQVTLPPGYWQLSLQYTSQTSLEVRAGELNSVLPAAVEHQGPYWSAGNITSTGKPLTIQVDVHAPPPLATNHGAILGNIALVRVGVASKMVPLHAACGRYVDWYVNS